MTPYFGKREPGSLTAASPGDTIVFPFASYNDSGDSEALTGLTVTDIEVFKNGQPTTRATDSGYSLISDTGQVGDRVGLYRCSVQLFNTADDTGHYESGASYQVAIDAVTIDGKNVRFWLGSFDIGRQRVDVREFNDTGVNERLARIQSDVDTGLRAQISDVDTGVHQVLGVIASDADTGLRSHISDVDTGVHQVLGVIASDVDTGLRAQLADVDTGIHDSLADYDTGLRFLLNTTGINVRAIADTGLNERLARIQSDADTGLRAHVSDVDTGLHDTLADYDTGLRGILTLTGVAVTDTGINERLARIQSDVDTGLRLHVSDADTGIHDAIADLDTGLRAILTVTGVAVTDTGVNERLARIQSDVDTGLRTHVNDLDTGLHDTLSDYDTGLRFLIGTWDVSRVRGDTGAGQRLFRFLEKLDTGGDISVPQATIDTGVVNQAVWQADATRGITAISDTGLNERLARIQSDVDTGIRVHIDDLDTGLHAHIADLDTGLHDTLADYDTGLRALVAAGVTANVTALRGDTGGADRLYRLTQKLDTGGDLTVVAISDTGLSDNLGRIRADVDTGLRAQIADVDTGIHAVLAVIGADADTGLRTVIGDVDTGLHDAVADLDTGLRGMIDDVDTGLHAHVGSIDTGVVEKTLQGVANRIFNADMTEMADSGTAARRTPLQALRALRNRVEADTGSLVVYKEDDATPSHTAALETDTGAAPIKTINPAGP